MERCAQLQQEHLKRCVGDRVVFEAELMCMFVQASIVLLYRQRQEEAEKSVKEEAAIAALKKATLEKIAKDKKMPTATKLAARMTTMQLNKPESATTSGADTKYMDPHSVKAGVDKEVASSGETSVQALTVASQSGGIQSLTQGQGKESGQRLVPKEEPTVKSEPFAASQISTAPHQAESSNWDQTPTNQQSTGSFLPADCQQTYPHSVESKVRECTMFTRSRII